MSGEADGQGVSEGGGGFHGFGGLDRKAGRQAGSRNEFLDLAIPSLPFSWDFACGFSAPERSDDAYAISSAPRIFLLYTLSDGGGIGIGPRWTDGRTRDVRERERERER
jgi:hypothetical protein